MSLNTFSEMAEDAALNLYLEHYGVKGQKKGSNRWWTPDKKLTPEGREHYGYGDGRKGSKTGDKEVSTAYRKGDENERKRRERADHDGEKLNTVSSSNRKKTDSLSKLSNDISDASIKGDTKALERLTRDAIDGVKTGSLGNEHLSNRKTTGANNNSQNDIRSQINDLENIVLVKNSDVKKLVKATKKFTESSIPGHGGVLIDRQAYWEHKINKSPIIKEIKSEMSDDVKDLKQIAKKRDKMIEKFYKNEKLFNEYLNDAIEDVRKEREASDEEFTPKDRHRAEIYYKNDGRYELYRNFIISKDKRAKQYREIEHQYDASRDALRANVKKFVNEWVGELGNERVPNEWYYSNNKLTVNDFLAMRLFSSNAS